RSGEEASVTSAGIDHSPTAAAIGSAGLVRRGADREAIRARYVADERHAAPETDRAILHPNPFHLVQRQTAERAEPAGQIVKLSVDLFFSLEDLAFFRGVTIAPGGPL